MSQDKMSHETLLSQVWNLFIPNLRMVIDNGLAKIPIDTGLSEQAVYNRGISFRDIPFL